MNKLFLMVRKIKFTRLVTPLLGIICFLIIVYLVWLFLLPKPPVMRFIGGYVPGSSEARVSLLKIDDTGTAGLFLLDSLTLNKSGKYCIARIYLKDQWEFISRKAPLESWLTIIPSLYFPRSVFKSTQDYFPICSNGAESETRWDFSSEVLQTWMSLEELVPSTLYPYDHGVMAVEVIVEFAEKSSDGFTPIVIGIPVDLNITANGWEISELNHDEVIRIKEKYTSYEFSNIEENVKWIQFRRLALQRWSVFFLLISLLISGVAILFLKELSSMIEIAIAFFVGLIGVRSIVKPVELDFVSLIDVAFFSFYLLIIFVLANKILMSRFGEVDKEAKKIKSSKKSDRSTKKTGRNKKTSL